MEACRGWSLVWYLSRVRVVFMALVDILVVPTSFIAALCCFRYKVVFSSFNFWLATGQAVLGVLQLLLSYQGVFSIRKVGFVLFAFKISNRKSDVLAEGLYC